MKLERLTPAHVKQAVSIYLDHAWPDGPRGGPRAVAESVAQSATLKELRAAFETQADPNRSRPPASGAGEGAGVESKSSGASAPGNGAADVAATPEKTEQCRRYALRLGNHRYPWMKFIVQEYLVGGEFFFSVDTHDELRVGPDSPDYEGWLELQGFNRELKREIETHWARTDLPTHGDLRALCEGLARARTDATCSDEGLVGKRLLVVDDDVDVAEGEAAVLAARGYTVETAFDGAQVLARMAKDPLPDLVILDFAMPVHDGEEVMRALRADARTRDVPILLATASQLDLTVLGRATGLLKKPYTRTTLYAMVDRLLLAAAGPERD